MGPTGSGYYSFTQCTQTSLVIASTHAPSSPHMHIINLPTGTVVEALGAPGAMDCILVSQKGLQGTSRGARYVVLTDEVGLTADEIQRLTFWNCFLYGRCTLPISVPPPVYHADRLAMRGRQLLSAQYGEEASDVASVGSGGAGCSDQAGGGVVLGRIPISAALVDSMFFA